MANVYDRIKTHKTVKYYAQIAKVNSRYGQIIAEFTGGHTQLIAEVDLKTNKVTYEEGVYVPEVVEQAIESWAAA